MNTSAFINIALLFQGFGMFPLAFVPRIDIERNPPFLPAHPNELISQGRFNHVPLIVGVTENEGALVTACNSFLHHFFS